MRVLEVIPISKSRNIEILSYFTASDVAVGSVIKVPLRKKVVPALVIQSDDIRNIKSEIKRSAFALKKIEKIKSSELLRSEFVEAAKETAQYYAGFTGSVLHALVPNIFFENAEKIKIPEKMTEHDDHHAKENFVIQSNDEDRYAHYKSIIREEFAKNSSVFFCLPTIQDIKIAAEIFSKGIEQYTFVLHSLMNKKQILEMTNKILNEFHPVLIIATGAFLSIPKQDIHTIIVDKENSRAYKQQIRPYLDIRNFAEIFAKKIQAKIIFGDILLRTETIYRHKLGEFVEIAPLKFRSLTTSKENLIDMREKKENEKAEFRIFSPLLEKTITDTVENNFHIFLFAARRGLSPSTVCADCGNIVTCNTCGAHVVLHISASGNFFLCHTCGERRSAKELCVNCGGWRLTTLGIGSELVEEKLKERYPNANIFRIDADKTPTHQKALLAAEKFYNSPSAILIGTEMALLYLTKKIENSAVISMDTFFSIPDFRIHERIMTILLKIRAITDRSLIIQTRNISQKVFEYTLAGNLIDFLKDEMNDRKMLHYPPFSTLIKISASGKKHELAQTTEAIQKMIVPYEMNIFPAFIPRTKGEFSVNGIVKIPERKWPDKNIIEKLKSLPMNVSVNVDPDSLL